MKKIKYISYTFSHPSQRADAERRKIDEIINSVNEIIDTLQPQEKCGVEETDKYMNEFICQNPKGACPVHGNKELNLFKKEIEDWKRWARINDDEPCENEGKNGFCNKCWRTHYGPAEAVPVQNSAEGWREKIEEILSRGGHFDSITEKILSLLAQARAEERAKMRQKIEILNISGSNHFEGDDTKMKAELFQEVYTRMIKPVLLQEIN